MGAALKYNRPKLIEYVHQQLLGRLINWKLQQDGTGPSRRHIQGSKIAKGLPSVNLQYSKFEKAKKWTEWRAGVR